MLDIGLEPWATYNSDASNHFVTNYAVLSGNHMILQTMSTVHPLPTAHAY